MVRTFLKTIIFLTPLFLPVILIGGIFGAIGVIIGLLISFILCIFIVHGVDKIILRFYKAHPALPENLPELREKTRLLSDRAGVPIPSIYITGLSLPSSFIVGKSQDKTALVIPERLLNLLKNDELETMLAYNIVQINNIIRLRTLAALVAGILTASASAIRWGAVFTGFGDYNDPAPKLFGMFIMGLVSPPAATMIHVLSKDYDAEAAMLCRNPAALISAVEQLEQNNVTAYPSLGFLCLIDPQKENFFEYLFNAHPAKEIRIKNLTERGQKA